MRILKGTYLEDVDGAGGTEEVVAVGFDPVITLQKAISFGSIAVNAADVDATKSALTLAADGGPVRRATMTVFTLSLSAPWLQGGRTPFLPVLYLLSGEQTIHGSVGSYLNKELHRALLHRFTVPTSQPGSSTASISPPVGATPPPRPSHRPDADPATSSTPLPLGELPPGLSPHHSGSTRPGSTLGSASQAQTTRVTASQLDGSKGQKFFCLPVLVYLVGDFAMLAHMLGLTGGSDAARCPYKWPCPLARILSPAACVGHMGKRRTVGTLTSAWEMAVWTLARWTVLSSPRLVLTADTVVGTFGDCDGRARVFLPGPVAVCCRTEGCTMYREKVADVLPFIADTPMSTMWKRLRRQVGCMRGYPIIRDVPFVAQAPVMHCTGKILKCLIFFLLAMLTKSQSELARAAIYASTGRANMGGLYLREFWRVAAHVIACPEFLGAPVDGALMVMMQLAVLLAACWRRAISSCPEDEREAAADTLQLVASLLGVIYKTLKPLDPGTKNAGVFNLYLHGALAHVRETIGVNGSGTSVICDDHIEGMIAELNAYFNTRTNNVSRGQSLVNMQALSTFNNDKKLSRVKAEAGIYTSDVVVFSCWRRLGDDADDELQAIVDSTAGGGHVTVDTDTNAALAVFSLPSSLLPKDRPPSLCQALKEDASAEERFRGELQLTQETLHVCLCGQLTGRPTSSLFKMLTATAVSEVTPDTTTSSAAAYSPSASNSVSAATASPTILSTPLSTMVRAPTAPPTAAAPPAAELHIDGLEDGGASDGDVSESDVEDAVIELDAEGMASGDVHGVLFDFVDLVESDGEGGGMDDNVNTADAEVPAPLPPALSCSERLCFFLGRDSDVMPYIPPTDICALVFDGAPCTTHDSDCDAGHSVSVGGEVAMLDIFLARAATPSFANWAAGSGSVMYDLCEAARAVRRRLLDLNSGGSCATTMRA